MKYIFFLLFALILCACPAPDSACIDDRITTFEENNSERSFTFIYTFDQDSKTFYVFDSGIAFDATAEVVDEDCNVVCVYGGNRPAPENSCEAFQESINNAERIWPK
ncbi:MAG: hypothetical protein ACI9FN_002952 [Saprospiraceae bacterium]|jgi:hypothetical protein